MSEKLFDSGLSLHEKLVRGIDKLADNVAATYGPRGRNVILHGKDKNPIITKDGVTVAKFTNLEDPIENSAAQIIKQAAAATASDAGDGTTTATILARACFKQARKYIMTGASPVEIKRGMDKAVAAIVERLSEISRPIQSEEDITHIATISANGDATIGSLISKAVDLAGKDGAVSIEEARSVDTSLDVVEGFRFDSGYFSPKFITNERKKTVDYDDPLILVTDARVSMVDDILPVLEVVAREGRPLIIIAEDVEGQALAALIMNAIRGTMKVAAVKAPRYGEERRGILKDLAISMGAEFVSVENGLSLRNTRLENLGTAKKVEISKSWTTIMGGNGMPELVEKQIDLLKDQINATDELHECERLQERITRLASGVAIIRVGGATEIEMIEKKYRIEDALEAVNSAQQEGIVPGGGAVLIHAAKSLHVEVDNEDQELGVLIVKEAIYAPIKQMASNAGQSPDIIVDKVSDCIDQLQGWDFANGEIVNMLEAGIVDPVKVTRCALQNAVSVASTLITTSHAIVEI
jgi:chaperonin GroEL